MDMNPRSEYTTIYEYEGKMVKIKGHDYCMPPLNLRQMKALLPKIDQIGKLTATAATVEQQTQVFDLITEILAAALSRNHPDVTVDFLLDNLDGQSVMPLFEAVMEISGLAKGAGPAQGGAGESPGASSTVS